MLFSPKMFALSTLFMSLVLLSTGGLLAISEEAPIIAVANNNIYAVSPRDGEARLLVERDPEKDAMFTEMGAEHRLGLSEISPDNTKFAYNGPLYELLNPELEDRRFEIANLNPRDLTLVDIASGQLTPITHQRANLAEIIESDTLRFFGLPRWSVDGQRLYFMTSVKSTRDRVSQQMIEYYDLQTGERHLLVKLHPHADILSIYAAHRDWC